MPKTTQERPVVEFIGGHHDGELIYCSSEPAILFVYQSEDGALHVYDQPYTGTRPYFRETLSADRTRCTYTAWLNDEFRRAGYAST